MNKNRRYNNKRKNNYPTGIQRLDAELMSEIKLFVSLGNTIEYTARKYKVSEQMVKYAIKKGKDFNSLQNDLEEDE